MKKINEPTDYFMEMMMEEPKVNSPFSFPSIETQSHANGRAAGGQASSRRAEGQAFLKWVQGFTSTAIVSSIPMPAIPMPAIPMPAIPMPAIDIDELMIDTDYSPQEELQKSAMNDHYPYLEKLEDYIDIKFLYKNTRGKPTENNLNSLHIAAISGETKTVEDILKQGEINTATEMPFYNLTPLHLAAFNGHTETVQALLTNGADTKMLDRMHRTAFELATLNGHTETAEKIEEYKLNERINKIINIKVHNNGTPNLPTYVQNGVVPDILDSAENMLKVFNYKRKLGNQADGKDSASAGQAESAERAIKRTLPALKEILAPVASSTPIIKRTFPALDEALEPVASEDIKKPSANLRGKDRLFSNFTSGSNGKSKDDNARN